MSKKIISDSLAIALLFGSVEASAAERIAYISPDRTSFVTSFPNASWNSGNMSAEEISCILRGVEVEPNAARAAGQAFAKAIKAMKFETSEFNKPAAIHLLAQSWKESERFTRLIQRGARRLPSEKRGYGYLQLTGSYNRNKAAKCMRTADPGTERGVLSSPERTIGKDPYLAALASLCWWQANVVNHRNPDRNRVAMLSDSSSTELITRIVNGGSPHGRVTNGKKNINERDRMFNLMMIEEPRCRRAS